MTDDLKPGVCSRNDCSAPADDALCNQHWVEARMIASGYPPGVAEAGARGESIPVELKARPRLTVNPDGSPLGVEKVSVNVTMSFRRAVEGVDDIKVLDIAPDALYDPETGEKLR